MIVNSSYFGTCQCGWFRFASIYEIMDIFHYLNSHCFLMCCVDQAMQVNFSIKNYMAICTLSPWIMIILIVMPRLMPNPLHFIVKHTGSIAWGNDSFIDCCAPTDGSFILSSCMYSFYEVDWVSHRVEYAQSSIMPGLWFNC